MFILYFFYVLLSSSFIILLYFPYLLSSLTLIMFKYINIFIFTILLIIKDKLHGRVAAETETYSPGFLKGHRIISYLSGKIAISKIFQ